MDFKLPPEEEKFKAEFTEWLENNLPETWDKSKYNIYESDEEWEKDYRDFQKRLFDAGYAGLHYSKEYGGRGSSLLKEIIVVETIGRTCLELRAPGLITFGMVAPTIMMCGNEEQKKEFIPKILDGSNIWCQVFSEPGAGSDVANISTTAVRENGNYIVNGQKVWISFAHMSDYCMLLVRTDTEVAKHKGLSYLLVDMKTPGIQVRPIKQITGEAEFNEIFFDDVKVPSEMLVGKEGQGWEIALTTLMYERVVGDAFISGGYVRNINNLIKMASETSLYGRPVIKDPVVRQQLAQSYIEIMAVKYHGLRNISQQLKGGLPGPEGSIGKLMWSEANQRLCETAINIQGPYGQIVNGTPWAIEGGTWQSQFLRSKGNTIEAGTSEIQRNIIAERVLGLPKN
ncbi:MAG: acyl-CoA dehydrogenase [Desulfobacterales bacterium]|jgi:alkylation response protein AidB-like acyl-CoA dehydrogenase|nr:acyl-CoA dehydrogenase [Desulfobacteraceae bacterium]MBT7697066.1 acyl-CoA dehydrogenase [Desulfobacterales bacterium]